MTENSKSKSSAKDGVRLSMNKVLKEVASYLGLIKPGSDLIAGHAISGLSSAGKMPYTEVWQLDLHTFRCHRDRDTDCISVSAKWNDEWLEQRSLARVSTMYANLIDCVLSFGMWEKICRSKAKLEMYTPSGTDECCLYYDISIPKLSGRAYVIRFYYKGARSWISVNAPDNILPPVILDGWVPFEERTEVTESPRQLGKLAALADYDSISDKSDELDVHIC